jgi:hypothetical protein
MNITEAEDHIAINFACSVLPVVVTRIKSWVHAVMVCHITCALRSRESSSRVAL